MLVLLQGLIPKKPDDEEEKDNDEYLEDDEETNSAEEDGIEGTENNNLKPDNLL